VSDKEETRGGVVRRLYASLDRLARCDRFSSVTMAACFQGSRRCSPKVRESPKKEPKILLRTFHEYEEPGTYTIVIKVIDILGNDTTKAVAIEVCASDQK